MVKDMDDREPPTEVDADRRRFLSRASTLAMGAGLAGGYGAFGLMAGRYLYPAKPAARQWQFVAETRRLRPGETLLFRAPGGETINVTCQGRGAAASDFIALSSTCPHLGCQVHWEAQNERYFCPCHNGTFDPQGKGTGGPPGEAGQSLPRYPLKVEAGLLYIEVPVDQLAAGASGEVLAAAPGIHAPGHDPCLACGRENRFSRRS